MRRSLQSLIDGDLEGALDFIAERALLGKERRAYFEKQADPFDKNQISNALSRGLIGAGVGAGLGGLHSMLQNKEHRRPLSSMLQGAALGGLGTAAGSFAYDNLNTISPTTSPPVEAYNKQEELEGTIGDQYKSQSGLSRPYAIGAGLGAVGAADTAFTTYNRRASNPKWLRAATENMPEELAKLIKNPSTTDADLERLHVPGPPSPALAGRTASTVRMPGQTVEPGGINHLVSELSKDPGGKPSLAVLEGNLAGDKGKTLTKGERKILQGLVDRAKGGGGDPELGFQTLLQNERNLTIGSGRPNYNTFRNKLLEGASVADTFPGLEASQQSLISDWRQHAASVASNTKLRTDLLARMANETPGTPAYDQLKLNAEAARLRAERSQSILEYALGSPMPAGKKGVPGTVSFADPAGGGQRVNLPADLWRRLTGQRDPTTLSQEQLGHMANTPPGTKPVSPADVLNSLRSEKPSWMSAEQYSALLNDPALESKLGLLMGAGGKKPVAQSFGGMEIPYETIQRYVGEQKSKNLGFGKGWMRTLGGPFGGAQTAGGLYMPRLPMYALGGYLGDKLLGQNELPPDFFNSLQADHPYDYSQLMNAARKVQEYRVAGDAPGAAAAQRLHEEIIQELMKKYGR